ncbi:Putative Glycoside Hydrolase Family 17 [Podospora comata]|uniref:Probable beta-glucosidase btgE n=1 Tax=Podospora comata TaxID=48703 RepID=A0ABY6RWK4_PODCO|nr:Putative Glycoside Hydrolase Family 17 [Podospora comata]
MKAAVVAAAAAVLAGGASAHSHRHAHKALFQKRSLNDTEVCVPTCTTIYSTIYGEETWIQPPPKSTEVPVPVPVITTTPEPEPVVVPTTTTTEPAIVPTPIPQICPTPGTYTFPATTIVVTETTTVCAASTTEVPSGTHTLGGVTTVVETATEIVCPYATTEVENGVVTSVIKTTTFVCPSAGTYTIAPITTVVPSVTTVVVPVVTTYCPGTYTAPAVVTTITETNVVVYCPFTSSEIPAPTPQAVTPKPQAAPEPAPAPAPAPEKPKAVAPPPASTPAKGKGSVGGGKLGGKGKHWAMTYTPFRPDGHCKTYSEVDADVKIIASKNFEALRIYSTDCDTLPNVGAAAEKYGLRLIIGLFVGSPGCDNGNPTIAQQISALKEWKKWHLVDLCVVGNEALFNGYCSVQQLADLIVHTKKELGSAGYTGPYTTTDVLSAFEAGDMSPVCNVIDVVSANVHAYFNYQTTPGQAGKFVRSQLDAVSKICGGKPSYCMETGWPTSGVCNGAACAGVPQQKEAIASIEQEIGQSVVFFSFRDDPWKKPGACNCERSWGSDKAFGY